MFLTPGEIAFGGVLLGGIISTASAQLTARVGRRSEHAKALSNRQFDLYANVMREALDWQRSREPGRPRTQITADDVARTDETRLQFQMFGHEKIRRCYVEHFDKHWAWVGQTGFHLDAVESNREVLKGDRHPNDETAIEQLLEYAGGVKTARAEADRALEALISAVGEVVRGVPKLKRREIRQARRAVQIK